MRPLPVVGPAPSRPPSPEPLHRPLLPPSSMEAAYAALEQVYRDLDAEIARLAPRCDRRGICCDFDLVDHVLYATKLEVDYLKDRDPERRWTRATGNRCPYLEEGRCGAREARMLGCRTYYCQPGWAPAASDLYERHYARLKEIAREHGLDWRYAPALELMRGGA